MNKFHVKREIFRRKNIPSNRCMYIAAAMLMASQMAYANNLTNYSHFNHELFGEQQEITVKGKIVSANGNVPLAGVTVKVLGSTKATSTNQDGEFEIKANINEVIEFTYIGHITKTLTVNSSSTNVQVQLLEDGTSLEEVVVTGYGTQRKKDLTGSVAIVDVELLKSQPAASAVEALQGKATGVQIVNDGAPGSTPQIKIRGYSIE
mgnify:CR=1 FL=1